MPKKLQISTDGGSTYSTFPGSTGDLTLELNEVTDTIFGFNVESKQPTIGQWNMSTNGIFKGVSGYNAQISKPGTPTSLTAAATTLVSGKTYQITNAANRVISFNDTVEVLDNAVNQTANVASIDYLNGTVTFLSSYTVTGPVTVTFSYIPMTAVASAKSFTLTQTQTAIDNSSYDVVQPDSGWRSFEPGLQTLSCMLGGIWNATNDYFATLSGRGIFYITIDLDYLDNPGLTVFKAFMKITNQKRAGAVGALETEDLSLVIWVPYGALVQDCYSWSLSTSPLPAAIADAIATFQSQGTCNVQYLPAGTTGNTPLDGITGEAFPIECSLANTIEGLNTFTMNFRGTLAPTAV